MNRALLLPRRNPASLTRAARFVGKYRNYRSIGYTRRESLRHAWRASK